MMSIKTMLQKWLEIPERKLSVLACEPEPNKPDPIAYCEYCGRILESRCCTMKFDVLTGKPKEWEYKLSCWSYHGYVYYENERHPSYSFMADFLFDPTFEDFVKFSNETIGKYVTKAEYQPSKDV